MPSHQSPDGEHAPLGERTDPSSETSSAAVTPRSTEDPADDRSRGGQSGGLPKAVGPPQVSLLQVLVFAGLFAMSLALGQAQFFHGQVITEMAWFLIFSACGSASLAGLVFVIQWFTTGSIARLQEGEWLLIAAGVVHASWLLGTVWLNQFHEWPYDSLLIAGVFLPPVFFAPLRWRLLFAFAALRESRYDSDLFGDELSGAALSCFVALTLLGINVLLDCRGDQQYRWTHWLGIAAYAAPVAWTAGMLLSLLIRY